MKRATICLDPGITTGMAVISDPDGYLLATTNWRINNLRMSLDVLIRHLHVEGFTLSAVIERMPHIGRSSPRERDLEEVRRAIADVLETYEIPVTHVIPGAWKQSRAAAAAVLPRDWEGARLTAHQRDAIRMGCYALERKYAS